jgi:hypothetical protein
MGISETRSPWNTDLNQPGRGSSPGSQSSPSNAARSDSGHLANTLGTGHRPVSARRDAVPVQGGENRTPFDRLDRP